MKINEKTDVIVKWGPELGGVYMQYDAQYGLQM